MIMESNSRSGSPGGTSTTEAVSSPGKSSPLLAVEPPKKRAKFSISSILGEEEKKSDDICNSVKTPEDLKQDRDLSTYNSENSPGADRVLTPPSTPLVGSHRIPPEAAKYNAFLAQFSNPDVAKLYRWPLFFNPWMGMQGAPPPGALRPPLMPQPPFGQPPLRIDGTKVRSETVENKDALEAGEIVRPIAFRRPVPDPHALFKNGFSDPVHLKDLHRRSPSPYLEGRRDLDGDFKFSDGDRRNISFSDSDPNNDMVEIEVEEADDSDNEAGESDHSRHDSDGLKGSSCERKKKTRTVFSRSQIFQLETMFDMKRYLSSSERAGLAKALNMTETQVKIWFQNRRNKWKRQIAAEMEAANMSQVAGQRIMQLPYMYSHDEISRGLRSSLPMSPIHSGHPVVPPSVHHYYGGILRTHTS